MHSATKYLAGHSDTLLGALVTSPGRADLAERRRTLARTTRVHPDGHVVAIRALPDYDALFGVDFDPAGGVGPQRREEHR